ncbi:hypothetical protein [Actinoplanes sp. NPDC051851]|uniref:hypothetical protein n=1 Tax=Actinoplanes sp. NPDC051851 TaxID=3154753 RepID=UPI00342AD868
MDVVDLVRTGVQEISPEEMPLFDEVAAAWLDGRLGSSRTPGGTARIGVPSDLDITVVFDVVTGALGSVLGDATYARLRRRRWLRRRPKPQAQVTIDPRHRAALHAACVANGQELGLGKKKAVLLADSIFGPDLGDAA